MRHPLGRDSHNAHVYQHYGKAVRYLDNHFNMIRRVGRRARVGESAARVGAIDVLTISPLTACRAIRRVREQICHVLHVLPMSSKIG